MRFQAGREGTVLYVLKLSLPHLAGFLNLEGFLTHNGITVRSFPRTYPNIDDFERAVKALIADDDDLFARMADILAVWRLLCEGYTGEPVPLPSSPSLAMLLDWSVANIGEHITVSQAADRMGYSRYYFCRWFKSISGVTYLEYLTQVRIREAAAMLTRGYSVDEVSHRCGYENTPHFIRLFKRTYQCTPLQYTKRSSAISP